MLTLLEIVSSIITHGMNVILDCTVRLKAAIDVEETNMDPLHASFDSRMQTRSNLFVCSFVKGVHTLCSAQHEYRGRRIVPGSGVIHVE